VKFPQDSDVTLLVIDLNTSSNTLQKTLKVSRIKMNEIISQVPTNANIALQTKVTATKKLTPT
jgi:hypothetical protein